MFLPVKRLMRHHRLPVYMPGATFHHNIWHDRNRLYTPESLMPPYGFAHSRSYLRLLSATNLRSRKVRKYGRV